MQKADFVLARAETDAVEFWTGLLTWLWGLTLLCERHAFLTQPPFTGLMARAAPEWAWGLFLMALGTLKGIGLHCRIDGARIIGASVAAFAWSAVAGSFVVGGILTLHPSIMTAPFLVLACMNCWIIIRLVSMRYETRDVPGDRGDLGGRGSDRNRLSRQSTGENRIAGGRRTGKAERAEHGGIRSPI